MRECRFEGVSVKSLKLEVSGFGVSGFAVSSFAFLVSRFCFLVSRPRRPGPRDHPTTAPRDKKRSRRRPTLARAGPALPSAKRRLTSVFGMGTGIAASLWPPAKECRESPKWRRAATRRGGEQVARPPARLVPLGSTHRCACARGLSRSWSTTALGAVSGGKTCLGGGLALRCLQRLSVPGIATRHAAGATAGAPWARHSRSSRTRECSPQSSCARRG